MHDLESFNDIVEHFVFLGSISHYLLVYECGEGGTIFVTKPKLEPTWISLKSKFLDVCF